jgi:hypothetical protein
VASKGHVTLNKKAMERWAQRIRAMERRQRVTEEEHAQGLYIIRDKLRKMMETAQITDADNYGDALGPFYEVYLNSDLWDELEELVKK